MTTPKQINPSTVELIEQFYMLHVVMYWNQIKQNSEIIKSTAPSNKVSYKQADVCPLSALLCLEISL